ADSGLRGTVPTGILEKLSDSPEQLAALRTKVDIRLIQSKTKGIPRFAIGARYKVFEHHPTVLNTIAAIEENGVVAEAPEGLGHQISSLLALRRDLAIMR